MFKTYVLVKELQKQPSDLTEVDKAWLAAIIDGEGYISKVNGDITKPRLVIANTCQELMFHCYHLIDGSTLRSVIPKSSFGKKRQYFVSLAKRDKLLTFLNSILPYLIAKKERAEDMILWINEHPAFKPSDITPARRIVFESEEYKSIKRLQADLHRGMGGRFISKKTKTDSTVSSSYISEPLS